MRFIPAYAGNSPSWLSPLYAMAVHPRLRGELNSLRQTASKSLGSSPLTRGTLSDDNDEIMLRRFIPAYAGNSRHFCSCLLGQKVHPRLRGELPNARRREIVKAGSSPLTRGTHFDAVEKKVFDRFIPAYAGNSPVSAENNPQLSVHPRLRGELCLRADITYQQGGSSPLTRGTHLKTV